MELTVCWLLSFIALALGAAIEVPNDSGWFVPTIDGKFQWYPRELFELQSASIQPRAKLDAKFYLYTKSNPSSPRLINVNDASALSASDFNKKNPTRFIIHGWQNDYKSDVNVEVRSALLATGNYNVFCVDWSASAGSLNYAGARGTVADVGVLVASFIDFLNEKGGMSFSSLVVIGHSLGAHVSGFAGKSVKRGKISQIVGLDPALPLFNYKDCSTRLCPSDAGYVESIQTNGGLLGFLEPIGKSAFYPNGGKSQPGCGVDVTGSCAHGRSYTYYSEAIRKNSFPSMKCASYEDAVKNNCGNSYSSVRMGALSNTGTNGHFYVPVSKSSPYGMG